MKNRDILLEKYLTKKVKQMLLKEDIEQPISPQPAQPTQQVSGNPFDKIGSIINQEAGAITQKLNDPNLEKEFSSELTEGVALLAGLVLSVGKITELTGQGLSKLGKAVGADEKAMINKVSDWMIHKGEAYTHKIEDMIIATISKTPFLGQIFAKLDPAKKKVISKTILTTIVSGLAIVSGVSAVKALLNSENLMGVIEGLLTGVKSSEVYGNIPIIIKNLMTDVVA